MTIETQNLKLISCDQEILNAAIKSNETLAEKIRVNVPENWTEFGVLALQYALDRLTESNDEKNWWTYFPILKNENKLIGSGGYKGKPNEQATVEIGYEIATDYRNQGLATEMAMALVTNAFKNLHVNTIIAHTLGEENASTKVLQKSGFKKVQEIYDPTDGVIWKWELKRK